MRPVHRSAVNARQLRPLQPTEQQTGLWQNWHHGEEQGCMPAHPAPSARSPRQRGLALSRQARAARTAAAERTTRKAPSVKSPSRKMGKAFAPRPSTTSRGVHASRRCGALLLAEYAQVTRMLGNGRLEAFCFDGVNRLCHIRGKLRKRVWIGVVRATQAPRRLCFPMSSLRCAHCRAQGDIILLGLREFQARGS